jgi:hypothetical protein
MIYHSVAINARLQPGAKAMMTGKPFLQLPGSG